MLRSSPALGALRGLIATAAAVTGLLAGLAAPTTALGAGTAAKDGPSLLGSYLVGRVARSQHDTSTAAEYFERALARDPGNELVLENAFFMEAAEGRFERAAELASKLIAVKSTHRLARIWLAGAEVKARNFRAAETHLDKAAGGGPIGELTTTLARAWVRLADGRSAAALTALDNSRLASAARTYIRYHRALIAGLSGRRPLAEKEFEAVFRLDTGTPRIAMAYARHAAAGGDFQRARTVLETHLEKVADDAQPMVNDLLGRLDGKSVIRLLVESPEQGFSEVFYGLGEALASEGGVSVGAMYLQLSLALRPNSPFALTALANTYELTRRYQKAIDTYDRVPAGTAMQKAIDIRKAVNLNQLERVEDSKVMLERLAKESPGDRRPLITLGDILRSHKRYAEAVTVYTRVIELTPAPTARDWVYWYARGTSYERLKKWPLAEADLLKALELEADQPLVLNYLGYSWVDQNRNLKRGMAMIEKAVAAKPDDGYIVDSLGWANYRLGKFDEAVRYLERAVELRPEDPTLNDHLGDAYWQVGRRREARFQWDQALTLKPEPEEIGKIKEKIEKGLPDATPIVRERQPASAKKASIDQLETTLSPTLP